MSDALGVRVASTCPCGTGGAYAVCCGRFLDGAARPATALELMRSRYTAFSRGDAAYLVRTWHPRTRPDALDLPDPGRWRGLQVLDVVDGGTDDQAGVVDFQASYADASGGGVQRERSRFARRAGRWLYLDAEG